MWMENKFYTILKQGTANKGDPAPTLRPSCPWLRPLSGHQGNCYNWTQRSWFSLRTGGL
jgi:hypothetical protein